ncbi:MAG: hypothetical protein IBX55_13555 [Methyloprofundus sp.]|nr:hypothetical protein [Methyloprofundus sp.]
MALNPQTGADNISQAYQLAAGIDASGQPAPSTGGNFPQDWAQAYDDYAIAGVVPGAANTGGDKSILESFFSSGVGNSSATITTFAMALADYWATVAVDPGAPAHGGTAVVSVENDAASHIADFETAIVSSMSSDLSTPFFLVMVQNIQTLAVDSIIWSVTELVGGTPTTFQEVIT